VAGVGPAEATPWSTSSDRASLPFIAALTGTAAFGIVDWPVALLVGGGHLIARQRGQQQERPMSTADVGDSVLLVEPTDLLNEPPAPDPDAVRQPVGAPVGNSAGLRTATLRLSRRPNARRRYALSALTHVDVLHPACTPGQVRLGDRCDHRAQGSHKRGRGVEQVGDRLRSDLPRSGEALAHRALGGAGLQVLAIESGPRPALDG